MVFKEFPCHFWLIHLWFVYCGRNFLLLVRALFAFLDSIHSAKEENAREPNLNFNAAAGRRAQIHIQIHPSCWN